MDCILSYHLNPFTCGVARFNQALGKYLNLPVLQVFSQEALAARRPLLSIKLSEFVEADIGRLSTLANDRCIWPELRLFFHDYSSTMVEEGLMRRAVTIYCANRALTDEISSRYRNAIEAWCPGYLFDQRPIDYIADVKIYTFGMAHKLQAVYYYKLRDLLHATGRSFVIFCSAAIHEGGSLEDSFTSAYKEISRIFDDRVVFLGFVSDRALYTYLMNCDYFAAFFPGGVKANNTSVSSAMQCGTPVLTNLGKVSPTSFRHLENLIDINQCHDGLPLDRVVLSRIAAGAKALADSIGWKPLIDLFCRREPDLGDR